MKELNELVELTDEAIASSTYSLNVKVSDILAIEEAFRELEQRAEAAEAAFADNEEAKQLLFVQRDTLISANLTVGKALKAAEAKLAELEKQEPVAWVLKDSHRGTSHVERNKQVADLFSVFKGNEVTPLFTRPAPAINLAELMPEQSLNGQARFLGDKEPYYNRGWNDCRAAILRKIEEATK